MGSLAQATFRFKGTVTWLLQQAKQIAMEAVLFEDVGMTCEGCSGAIQKILQKIEGVEHILCNVDAQTVRVDYNEEKVTPKQMYAKMKVWATAAGKELGPCPE